MFTTLPIERLIESPQNVRQHWRDGALEELAASIGQVGVLTPLLVRPTPIDIVDNSMGPEEWEIWDRAANELLTLCSSRERAEAWVHAYRESDRACFEIAAGHRRFRAAQIACLTELPVQIRDLGDREPRPVRPSRVSCARPRRAWPATRTSRCPTCRTSRTREVADDDAHTHGPSWANGR